MLKNSKGITLIALVITIIVLLILAGVTISLVLNNGLIDRATNATGTQTHATVKEQLVFAMTDVRIDVIENVITTAVTTTNLDTALARYTLNGKITWGAATATSVSYTYSGGQTGSFPIDLTNYAVTDDGTWSK